MPGGGTEGRRPAPGAAVRGALRTAVLVITFLLVAAALFVSCALVVYTAWAHDLRNGLFALLFAVLSSQIALNWLRWKDEEI